MRKSNEIDPSELVRDGDWQEPSPEDFLPTAKPPAAKIYRIPDSRSVLPAINFLIISFAISVLGWQSNGGAEFGISYEAFFHHKDYWRSLTALFAHADMAHFLSNGWLLFLFGWFLRDHSGLLAFPGISIFIGVICNILTVMTMPEKTYLVGASGMIYGMVGLWIVLYLRHTPISLRQRILRSLGFILLMLVPTTFRPEVSYMAHGLGFGLGLTSGLALILSPFDLIRKE